MNIFMAKSFAMTPLLMPIIARSILGNNGVGLGSTVVDFIVMAIGKDITISMNISMTKSLSTIAIDRIMTIGRGSIFNNNWVGLGSTVVHLVVVAIGEDITVFVNETMAISIIVSLD